MKARWMVGAVLGFTGAAGLGWAALGVDRGPSGGPMSCATFQVAKGDVLLIGHNLDDAENETPGMIVVNKRGVAKESVSYADLKAFSGRDDSQPRLRWTSAYGSITYNVFGKEFPDGGMNEAGLYVGEMTLLGSVYPKDAGKVNMYHHAWMQYLLDTCSQVPEVLDSLKKINVDGHCQWHFFVADRSGRAAVIEFDEGKSLVYTGEALPVKVSTNYTYPSCLKKLSEFEGFGGKAKVDYALDPKKDRRFVWAADRIRKIDAGSAPPTVAQVFEILAQMGCGANRWALVFDPKAMRVTFHTEKCRTPRWVDFASCDFTCETPVQALDINRALSGDVAPQFVPLTDAMNREFVDRFFSGIDVGFLGNLFWKGQMVRHLQAYQATCKCPSQKS